MFGKKKQLLPRDVVAMMERFGRHEIDPMRSPDDGGAVWQATQQPLFQIAQSRPDEFVAELARECLPVGGWAVYGAERSVINLIGLDVKTPEWFALLDASIEFLRANHVPPMRVPAYAWNRFVDNGGSGNTWLELRPPPSRDEAEITPLGAGEVRRVMTLGPEADANVVLVRADGDEFVALVDAKWSDEDPTRSQSDFKRAEDLYELYVDIAYACQVWDWVDAELERFLPAPKATI